MNNPTIQPETLYTSEAVSDYLHVSQRTLQRLLQAGTLPSYKVHGQYRIKGLDVMNYLDGVRRDPGSLPVEAGRPAELLASLDVAPVSVALAPDLARLADPAGNPDFMPALQALRKRISLDLGFILPGVQVHDDAALAAGQYRILVHGQLVAKGEQPRNGQANDQMAPGQLALLTHLERVVRQFAHEILSRDEVFVMIERLRRSHPVVVDEVLSLDGPQAGKLTIGQLTRVLRGLLTDQVSIRNLARILEILADRLESTSSPTELVEAVRQGLSRQLCAPLADEQGLIRVVGLSPDFEAALSKALAEPLAPGLAELSRQLFTQLKQQPEGVHVLLCAPPVRAHLASVLQRNFGHWQVLSYQEVDRLYRLELAGSVELPPV